MSSFRWLTLVACFFMDVHVHADECWGKSVPCAVRSKGREVLESHGIKLSLGPKAIVEARGEKQIQLVHGSVYVEVVSKAQFGVAFGSVTCEKACSAIFERSTNQLRVLSLAGTWKISRLGDRATYSLPVGYQVSLEGVGSDGKAALEFPQSLPWDSTLKSWASLYPGNFDAFKKAVTDFRRDWEQAVEAGAELQSREASRVLASHQKSVQLAESRKKRQEQEDEGLRKLFREKNDIYR